MLNSCIWPGCLASCIVLWNIHFWHGSLNSVRAEASIWVVGDYTTRNCTCRLQGHTHHLPPSNYSLITIIICLFTFFFFCWTPACTVKFLLVENNVILSSFYHICDAVKASDNHPDNHEVTYCQLMSQRRVVMSIIHLKQTGRRCLGSMGSSSEWTK